MGLFDRTRMQWTPEALELMQQVPFFVRPFVRKRAETVARERGMPQVTAELLQELKTKEGPPGV